MSNIDSKARDLFLQALDQPAEQVADWLADACGIDSELRKRVQALLDAHQKAGGFMGTDAEDHSDGSATADDASDNLSATVITDGPKTGTTIGPYKLLEQIGEGGMGSVWVATQSKPIKRKVAIKLIKPGMDSRQVLGRFEAERQALAMMDHPNIARVLDGGVTEQGHPYFAMDYVKGVPLTEYCDNAKLSLKERLELFVPICQAVQHAHQKGIIHRDLKPSNILICLYDGKPVPKVIDFGLAKAMHHSLTEQSIYTAHGMMVGTPLYMSPEQAEHNNLDIDTRTDIYALGVILYELLTGTTPLEKAKMKRAAYDEVLRLIKEVEPPKPSTRLSGSESLPSVAAQRGIEPTQLTRVITGDLDWVVMKALEKERGRRYETANGLAEDIRRHLADEPVSASPPSTSYRMKKFIRRNRAGVIAASAIAITLLLGVMGTTGGMLWALAERRDAVAAREAETEAKQQAITNAALAKDEAARATDAEAKTAETLKQVATERDAKELALREAEQLSEFLTNVFQSPDPTKDGREIKVVELLDNAANKLETDLADQPKQRAMLQATLAKTYHALGLYDRAIHLQEKVLAFRQQLFGLEQASTRGAMARLASYNTFAGRWRDGLALREELVALCQKHLGPDHPETAGMMNNLANSYYKVGRTDEALKLREEVAEILTRTLGSEHPRTVGAFHNLGISISVAGRHDEALQLLNDVVAFRTENLGSKHPLTIGTIQSVANTHKRARRYLEAIRLYEEILKLRREVLGPEHPETVGALHDLAKAYAVIGRKDRALKLREEVVEMWTTSIGTDNQRTAGARYDLGLSYAATGRYEEALKIFNDVVRFFRENSGPAHRDTRNAMKSLARCYYDSGQISEAFEISKELASLHPDAAAVLNSNAWRFVADPSVASNDEYVSQSIAWSRRACELKPDDANYLNTLGVALYRAEQWQESIDTLNRAVELGGDRSTQLAVHRHGSLAPGRD